MTKEQMLKRIEEIVSRCDGHYASRIEPEHALNGALTLMIDAYGRDSHHVATLLKRRGELASTARMTDAIYWLEVTSAVKGALENLRHEIEGGLLTSLERRVASEVLSDLVQLARLVLEEQGDDAKKVAAVLAAAAYEDTIRRIAKERAGVTTRDKLETVIGKLKDAGLLVSPQHPAVLGLLPFRNHALHAEWETIDRTLVGSVLGLVQELLLKHFS